MKDKVLWGMKQQEIRIIRKKGKLYSRIQMKLVKMTVNIIWTASLLKTSITVTKTPITTLKSIVKATLNLKNGKANAKENREDVGDELDGIIKKQLLQSMYNSYKLRIPQRIL